MLEGRTFFILLATAFVLASTVHSIHATSDDDDEDFTIEKRDFIPEDFDSYNRDEISPILITDSEAGDFTPDSAADENTAVKSDFEGGETVDFNENVNVEESGSESGSGSGETELKRETITNSSEDDQSPTIETETESGSDETSGSGATATTVSSEVNPDTDETTSKSDIAEDDEQEVSGSGSGTSQQQIETPEDSETEKLLSSSTTATQNVAETHYDGSVYKRNKIPESPIASTTDKKDKRQYISRPRFVIRDGYVYMKAPPMTQKTIVTTHIPRPPMVMPYNQFMHRYHHGMPAQGIVYLYPLMCSSYVLPLFPKKHFSSDTTYSLVRTQCCFNVYTTFSMLKRRRVCMLK